MLWLISDEHYYHQNIIKYTHRPFASMSDMVASMIEANNSIVQPGDVVYHLGDFGLASRDRLRAILSRLTGVHILIRGNHDRGRTSCLNLGFVDVLPFKSLRYGDDRLYLTHRPMKELPDNHELVVHGHSHNNLTSPARPFNVNVSVEMTNYKPVNVDWVLDTWRTQCKIARDNWS